MNFPSKKELKIKPGDFIILAFFLVTAILILGFTFTGQTKQGYLEVTLDGKIIHTFPLDTPIKQTINVGKIDMVFEITPNGKVRVLKSNCPMQICVKSRSISKPGESIICLPNKVILEIKGTSKSEIDAKTY